MNFYLFSGLNQLMIITVCCGGMAINLTGDNAPCQTSDCQVQQGAELLSLGQLQNEIQNEIQSITVEISSDDNSIGSGVLIYKKDNSYTVITNAHVLTAGKSPYQVQTPDGEKYTAQLIKEIDLKQNDLGLLEFKSKNNYPIAKIGKSYEIKEGQKVFVGGFPYKTDQDFVSLPPLKKNQNGLKGLVVKEGRVSLVLDKPLENGYQIGYTNDIRKGMSGGPVLNSQSELIGINGLHQDPLWDAPDFFQDGSTPCPPLQAIITTSSWSIPIETVVKLLPQSWQLQTANNPPSNNLAIIKDISENVLQLQKKAELAKKQCQNDPAQKTPNPNLKK